MNPDRKPQLQLATALTSSSGAPNLEGSAGTNDLWLATEQLLMISLFFAWRNPNKYCPDIMYSLIARFALDPPTPWESPQVSAQGGIGHWAPLATYSHQSEDSGQQAHPLKQPINTAHRTIPLPPSDLFWSSPLLYETTLETLEAAMLLMASPNCDKADKDNLKIEWWRFNGF